MSLSYMSRLVTRMMQGVKDQALKCDSTLRSLKDTASSPSSSKQARWFSGAVDSGGAFRAAKNEKLKQAEESLRTVMYLSCWGPN